MFLIHDLNFLTQTNYIQMVSELTQFCLWCVHLFCWDLPQNVLLLVEAFQFLHLSTFCYVSDTKKEKNIVWNLHRYVQHIKMIYNKLFSSDFWPSKKRLIFNKIFITKGLHNLSFFLHVSTELWNFTLFGQKAKHYNARTFHHRPDNGVNRHLQTHGPVVKSH